MCEIKKADISCDTKQAPMKGSLVDNASQEDYKFDDWKIGGD